MENNMKEVVRQKYAEIAKTESSCGCGCSDGKVEDYTVFQEDYSKFAGYVKDADLGLGCGVPTEHAGIKEGDVVVDLGSGAGNDVFVARTLVGETGKVMGIDMTQEMIDKAEKNKVKLGLKNVEFRLGDIEQLPLDNEVTDVVISNCVLNLVPNKKAAFSEIHRILKPGGHFCISDIVIIGDLPEKIRKSAEMYAGCVSGALQKDEYLGIIKESGFRNIEIKAQNENELPDDILKEYMTDEEIAEFRKAEFGIYSITVVGYK